MIIEAILNIVFGLLTVIINMFPSFNVPMDILGSVALVGSLLAEISYYFPVDTFITCVILYMLTVGSSIGLWAINWVIRRVFDVIP